MVVRGQRDRAESEPRVALSMGRKIQGIPWENDGFWEGRGGQGKCKEFHRKMKQSGGPGGAGTARNRRI